MVKSAGTLLNTGSYILFASLSSAGVSSGTNYEKKKCTVLTFTARVSTESRRVFCHTSWGYDDARAQGWSGRCNKRHSMGLMAVHGDRSQSGNWKTINGCPSAVQM